MATRPTAAHGSFRSRREHEIRNLLDRVLTALSVRFSLAASTPRDARVSKSDRSCASSSAVHVLLRSFGISASASQSKPPGLRAAPFYELAPWYCPRPQVAVGWHWGSGGSLTCVFSHCGAGHHVGRMRTNSAAIFHRCADRRSILTLRILGLLFLRSLCSGLFLSDSLPPDC
jgi:hypothetical protein